MKNEKRASKSLWVLAALIGFLVIPSPAQADLLDGLTAQQVAEVKAGQMVVTSKDIAGGVWPELTVYQLVKASSNDVSAVFEDYPNANKYIPNLISARMVNEPKPNVRDIEYTTKVPLFGKINYTVRNYYKNQGDKHTVSWELLESPLAKQSTGSLEVEPYGKDCILRYTNYVEPITKLAAVAKGKALEEVKATVTSIATEAERRAGRVAAK